MNLSRFDLNLLRALDALLTERNVTRAAERLFVTQQAMSGSLHRLREYFSDELLVRVGRKLEPTPLGAALALPVREALLRVEAALQSTPCFDPSTAQRHCRIAMSDYATLVLLPHFLRFLAREAPGITCQVESITDASFRKVEGGDLDFCLAPPDWRLYGSYQPSAGIRSDLLFEDDFVCIFDANHPDVGDAMPIELYRSLPHNALVLGVGIASVVEKGWNAAGLAPRVVATAPSFSALLFMLPGTRIIATAQRRLGGTLAGALGLRMLECPIVLPTLQENLTWHERNDGEPSHVYLRSVLQTVARQLLQ